ncbi:2534_t:CDS:2 [Cetraspora pellucida]|uniref:2534_t:CDS:1 n=1 Tax=Cetraspora pellucida TaxID=1433469 RepID=A0A9N9HEY1_9GLOM|nr:2534_t:CDS:2 [Cetraspora pellucida]
MNQGSYYFDEKINEMQTIFFSKNSALIKYTQTFDSIDIVIGCDA